MFARAMVKAAVRVVFPWSTWPIVPMFKWGFFLSNLPRAARITRRPRRERTWRTVVGCGLAVKEGDVEREREEGEETEREAALGEQRCLEE